jgi:hypothetical protein
MFVCLSAVRVEQLGSQWTDFDEIGIWDFLENL